MRKQAIFAVLVVSVFLWISGCGGSGGGSITPPPVAPSITTQPTNQTVTEGQTATFMVVASGTSPLSYQWQKNGVAIAGATSPSFTTPATVAADNGSQFKVTVSNSAGSVTSATAALTVNPAPVAPSITTQPVSQTVTEGQPATFNVTASGTSPLSYQWQKNGVAIAGATSPSFTTPVTVLADNGAQFKVVVSNSAGSVTSATATLTVNPLPKAPTIRFTSATTMTVPYGGTATFQLEVTGTPTPSVTCPVSGQGTAMYSGGTAVIYNVPNPSSQPASNQATVPCTAVNVAGSATTNPPVTVNLVGQILGATDRRFFCGFTPCFDQTILNLTGAFLNSVINSTCAPFNLVLVDSTHVKVIFGLGSAAKPQFCDAWITEPAPGGGDSNHITFGYLGSQPYSVLSSTEDIQFDLASGNIYRIKLADGSLAGSFTVGAYQSIAFNDQSQLIVANNKRQIVFYTLAGGTVNFTTLDQMNTNFAGIMSLAEQGDFGCSAQPQNNQIALWKYPGAFTNIPVTLVSVPGEPWNVQMSTLNGQPVCGVQTVNPAGIAVYAMSGQQLGFINAVGAASATTVLGTQSDNWQLTVVDAANGHKTAAALFKKDNATSALSLFLFDLATMAQVGNGSDLTGDPLRIGSDNVNHRVVVALADFQAKVTKFSAVDLSGNVSPLTPTVPFLVTSLPYPFVSGSDKNFAHPF